MCRCRPDYGYRKAQQAQAASKTAAKQIQTAQAVSTQAVEQKEDLEEEARRARAGELVAYSQNKMDTDTDLAYLLGIESYNSGENYLTRSNLKTLLRAQPQRMKTVQGHTVSVHSVAFSPDGKTLVSGSRDHTIRLWDASPQSWRDQLCDRVGRNFTQAEWEKYFPGEDYRKTCKQWPAGEQKPP